jgi:hypothetical protein
MRSLGVLLISIAMFLLSGGSAAPQSTYQRSGDVVFIHCGPESPDSPIVQRITKALVNDGFLVREPETDQDLVGGPGVDYFDSGSKEKADAIARLVNSILGPDKPQLTARYQRVRNPSYYYGVWLY